MNGSCLELSSGFQNRHNTLVVFSEESFQTENRCFNLSVLVFRFEVNTLVEILQFSETVFVLLSFSKVRFCPKMF